MVLPGQENLVLSRLYLLLSPPGCIKPWKRILVYGPPGTGKSRIVQAISIVISPRLYQAMEEDSGIWSSRNRKISYCPGYIYCYLPQVVSSHGRGFWYMVLPGQENLVLSRLYLLLSPPGCIKPWKRILVYGPPGTGKSRIAQAISIVISPRLYQAMEEDSGIWSSRNRKISYCPGYIYCYLPQVVSSHGRGFWYMVLPGQENLVLSRLYLLLSPPGCIKPWKRILVYGPPGTGKSRIVQAISIVISPRLYQAMEEDSGIWSSRDRKISYCPGYIYCYLPQVVSSHGRGFWYMVLPEQENLVLSRLYLLLSPPGCIKPWKRILVYGPPGTGKSRIVQAISIVISPRLYQAMEEDSGIWSSRNRKISYCPGYIYCYLPQVVSSHGRGFWYMVLPGQENLVLPRLYQPRSTLHSTVCLVQISSQVGWARVRSNYTSYTI